ncbi:MAG TPA: hypothetical protein VEJ46_13755 [Candidatus Acidoferrum sp.]|nr:hypothetical protein [Candidatus Acidoferrum sp.]
MSDSLGNLAESETLIRELEQVIAEGRRPMVTVPPPPTQPAEIARIMLPVVKAVVRLDSTLRDSEGSNRRLSQRLIVLTMVLVVLTAVIAWFTILLVVRH